MILFYMRHNSVKKLTTPGINRYTELLNEII